MVDRTFRLLGRCLIDLYVVSATAVTNRRHRAKFYFSTAHNHFQPTIKTYLFSRFLPNSSNSPSSRMPNQQVQATTRKVRLNSTQIVKFKSNSISTGKYTFVTFIPKFLYEQFRKYANIFFLCIGLLQQIPGISPTGRWITIGPFGVILTITAIKEIYEDFKRHREDQKINESKSEVLKGTTWKSVSWKDVLVGDIVRVKSEKSFPADLILLASSDGESQCYIETANLDGETNLKIRSAHIGTKQLKEAQELADLQGQWLIVL